jgi:hypothetical protein
VATCGELTVPVKVDPNTRKVTITISASEIKALFTASLSA